MEDVILYIIVALLVTLNLTVTIYIKNQKTAPKNIANIGIWLTWCLPFIGAYFASKRVLGKFKKAGKFGYIGGEGSSCSSTSGCDSGTAE